MTQFQLILVYAVYETLDEYGRRGSLIMLTERKDVAEEAAKGRGWWNSNADVTQKPAIRLEDGTVYLLESTTRYPLEIDIPAELKSRREAARAKLTDEEAKLLGIA